MAIVPAEMVTLRTQSICRYSEITDRDLQPIGSYWWAMIYKPRAYGHVRRLFALLPLCSPVGRSSECGSRCCRPGGQDGLWRFCDVKLDTEDKGKRSHWE